MAKKTMIYKQQQRSLGYGLLKNIVRALEMRDVQSRLLSLCAIHSSLYGVKFSIDEEGVPGINFSYAKIAADNIDHQKVLIGDLESSMLLQFGHRLKDFEYRPLYTARVTDKKFTQDKVSMHHLDTCRLRVEDAMNRLEKCIIKDALYKVP